MRRCVPLAFFLGLSTGCPDYLEGGSATGVSSTIGTDSSVSSTGSEDDDGPTSLTNSSQETGTTMPPDETDGMPDAMCGNGLVESGELCDEGNENGIGSCKETCQPNYCGDGYLGPGELCDDGNQIDGDACTASCTTPNCGNMNVEAPEECDDGNGNDNDDCLSTCVNWSCGDQQIHAVNEVCDTENVGANTCSSVTPFVAGTLVCNADCTGFDTSGCWFCGDGELNDDESCDGGALGGADCDDMGFANGSVTCNGACGLDFSACWTCGDGNINGPEQCDGSNLGGASCVSLGFDGGNLGCNGTTCQRNDAPCYECGDEIIEGPEQCEMGDTQSCNTFHSGTNWMGTVTCSASCMWNPTACCRTLGSSCMGGQTCCGAGNMCESMVCCLPDTAACTMGAGDQCCGDCMGGTCM